MSLIISNSLCGSGDCPSPERGAPPDSGNISNLAQGAFGSYAAQEIRDDYNQIPIPIIGPPINYLWRHIGGEVKKEEVVRAQIEYFFHRHNLISQNTRITIDDLHNTNSPACHFYIMLKPIIEIEENLECLGKRTVEALKLLDVLIEHKIICVPQDLLYRSYKRAVETINYIQESINEDSPNSAEDRIGIADFMSRFFEFSATSGINFLHGSGQFNQEGFKGLVECASCCDKDRLLNLLRRARESGVLNSLESLYINQFNLLSLMTTPTLGEYISKNLKKETDEIEWTTIKVIARDLGWKPTDDEIKDASEGSVLGWMDKCRSMLAENNVVAGKLNASPLKQLREILEVLIWNGILSDIGELRNAEKNSKADQIAKLIERYGSYSEFLAAVFIKKDGCLPLSEAISDKVGSPGWTLNQVWMKGGHFPGPPPKDQVGLETRNYHVSERTNHLLTMILREDTLRERGLEELRSDVDGTVGHTLMEMMRYTGGVLPVKTLGLISAQSKFLTLRTGDAPTVGSALIKLSREIGREGILGFEGTIGYLRYIGVINSPDDLILLGESARNLGEAFRNLSKLNWEDMATDVSFDYFGRLCGNIQEVVPFLRVLSSAVEKKPAGLIALIKEKMGYDPLRISRAEDIKKSRQWRYLFYKLGIEKEYVDAINIDELVERYRGKDKYDIDLIERTLFKIDRSLGKRFREAIEKG